MGFMMGSSAPSSSPGWYGWEPPGAKEKREAQQLKMKERMASTGLYGGAEKVAPKALQPPPAPTPEAPYGDLFAAGEKVVPTTTAEPRRKTGLVRFY